jgi:DNA-directed RNA polymerase specialized sigma24 family protein
MSDQLEQQRFRTLMRQAEEGSEEAAKELYDTYQRYVRLRVRSRLWHGMRSKFDSQDFAQQVWGSFFSNPDGLPDLQTPQDLIAYLRAMAERKVAQEARTQRNLKRNLSLETEVHEDSDMAGPHPATRLPTPSAMAIFEEQYVRLVENQTGATRAVAQLRYEGNTFEEIAQCLDLNEATARKVIRAMKRRESAVDPSNSDD